MAACSFDNVKPSDISLCEDSSWIISRYFSVVVMTKSLIVAPSSLAPISLVSKFLAKTGTY